jgi:hypothetical protein
MMSFRRALATTSRWRNKSPGISGNLHLLLSVRTQIPTCASAMVFVFWRRTVAAAWKHTRLRDASATSSRCFFGVGGDCAGHIT